MTITIAPQTLGLQEENATASIDVNNNWTYAVYLWTLAAVAGKVSVSGLDMFEDAVEKRFFEALQDNAVRMSIRAEFVSVQKGVGQAFQFDLAASPHLYLPLVVLAAHANGTSVLSSAQSAIDLNPTLWQHRIDVLQTLGVDVKLQDGLLIIKGHAQLNTSTISHTQDPELLVALCIFALNAPSATRIANTHLITAVFSEFIKDMNLLLTHKIVMEKE